MLPEMFFLALSLTACGIIIYIVTLLWFSAIHTRQVQSFLCVGITACVCIFFNAMLLYTSPQYYSIIFSAHTASTIVSPYAFLWFSLNFSGSKLTNSKPFIVVLCAILAAHLVFAATNPLHLLMLNLNEHGKYIPGRFFWIHAIFAYTVLLMTLFTTFRYVFRYVRTRLSIIAAFGTLIPIFLNFMLALDVLGSRFDFTSLGFFITFAIFFLTTYRTGPFRFRSIALTNVFTSLSDVTIIVNAHGHIEDANVAFQKTFPKFTITAGATTIQELSEWLSSCASECYPENLLTSLNELENAHKVGEFSILSADCATLPDNGEANNGVLTFTLRRDLIQYKKNPSGYLITMSDVSAYRAMIQEINEKNEHLTELKELAEQASRAKSTFLADMSHEIRTPINAITGMATIARGTDSLDKVHECLDKVDAASRQLLGIINDILDMSKIEANRMELSAEVFDLPAMFLNVKSMMDISAAANGQKLAMSIADDVPRVVMGDDMRLSQIFLNLLSNAVKFTPENGHIELSVKLLEATGSDYLLEASVKDDGIGITKEQQKRLFNSFEQADKGISRRYGGSGLGLAISKSLAKMMSGGIELESEPGKGSCFTVSFRLSASSERLIEQTREEHSYNFNERVALLVEDIAINREIVQAILQDNGVIVDCAENGQEAVEIFMAAPDRYDIIFMDIHMPVMDGYTATAMIRGSGLPTSGTVPIMAMTANAFAEDVNNCRVAGMNDHIAKPIEFDMLFRKMARLIPNIK